MESPVYEPGGIQSCRPWVCWIPGIGALRAAEAGGAGGILPVILGSAQLALGEGPDLIRVCNIDGVPVFVQKRGKGLVTGTNGLHAGTHRPHRHLAPG